MTNIMRSGQGYVVISYIENGKDACYNLWGILMLIRFRRDRQI